MSQIRIKRVHRKLSDEERRRHQSIREHVKRNRPRLDHEALDRKAQMEAAFAAMQVLKAAREERGISLGQLARRSGIDKANLSRLENDINANPTLETLVRIANAIGGRIDFRFHEAA